MNYKVVIAGSASAGKSAFCRRFLEGFFVNRYIPTLGTEVHEFTFNTNYGQVSIKCWDVSGSHACLGSGYYLGADAFVLMFDLNDKHSFSLVKKLNKEAMSVCGNVPRVICGNKLDEVYNRKKHFRMPKSLEQLEYVEMSVKSCFHIEEPVVYLLRQLTGHNDLVLIN